MAAAGAASSGPGRSTVKIFCRADESYSLTIRRGAVVLVRADPTDRHQRWIKEVKHSVKVKDEEGRPAFALVNLATGQALKHSLGNQSHPVGLVQYKYNPDFVDESVLWTESDVGDGYRCIRMVNNIHHVFEAFHEEKARRFTTMLALWKWCIRMVTNICLNFYGFHGDGDKARCSKRGVTMLVRLWKWFIGIMNSIYRNLYAFRESRASGGMRDGTILVLWKWCKLNSQMWKMEPCGDEAGVSPDSAGHAVLHAPIAYNALSGPTLRIFTRVREDYSVAIHDGVVVVAPADRNDLCQHWIKDMTKDGSAFALVNRITGEAIKHSVEAKMGVRLQPYHSKNSDDSVLWVEGDDTGDGFRSIRMLNNYDLCLDTWTWVVKDVTPLGLWSWHGKDDQKWKIVPYGNEAGTPWDCVGSTTLNESMAYYGLHGPTVRIYSHVNEGYSVTIRDYNVVLAGANANDPYQHWIKDMRYSAEVKDTTGNPAFALVNRMTGQALKPSLEIYKPVILKPYNPNFLDFSVLWVEGQEQGSGFRTIRMAINTGFHLDTMVNHVQDGTALVMWTPRDSDNQGWKIMPYEPQVRLPTEPTVRIFCCAIEGYNLAIHDGKIVLVTANEEDYYQHWIKDTRYNSLVKDDDGQPAFALVNSTTGQALKHSLGHNHPVHLCYYNPNVLDLSVMWTEGKDLGDGFRYIRMVNNIYLSFDFPIDETSSGPVEGAALLLFNAMEGSNQHWKMEPW